MVKKKENTEDITNDFKKISAYFLTKHGYFNGNYSGELIWTIGNRPVDSVKIFIFSLVDLHETPYMQLVYTHTDEDTGNKTNYNYKIFMEKVNSKITPDKYFYYFLCPLTGKRTSVLYKSPSGNMFLHFEAYQKFSGNSLSRDIFTNMENRYGVELEGKILKLKEKVNEKMKGNIKKVPLKLIERVRDLENRLSKLYVEPDEIPDE